VEQQRDSRGEEVSVRRLVRAVRRNQLDRLDAEEDLPLGLAKPRTRQRPRRPPTGPPVRNRLANESRPHSRARRTPLTRRSQPADTLQGLPACAQEALTAHRPAAKAGGRSEGSDFNRATRVRSRPALIIGVRVPR
jgi:hypothetical protein